MRHQHKLALAQSSTGAPHPKSHRPFSHLSSNKSRRGDTRPCLFQSGYSPLNHHKRDSQITRTKISYSLYSLIEPQNFLVHQPAATNSIQPQSNPRTRHKIYSTLSWIHIWNTTEVCGGALLKKQSTC